MNAPAVVYHARRAERRAARRAFVLEVLLPLAVLAGLSGGVCVLAVLATLVRVP